MRDGKKLISIACLCCNEADNITEAYEKILWLVKQCPQYDFEIVVADNGSTDGTRDILRRIAKEDERFKVIFNAANFGAAQSSANLLSNLSGDAYIPYPIDMQEPIEVLPEMLSLWESGYDVVWGQKTESDEKKTKYFLRCIYYGLIDFFSYNKIPHQVISFGVTDRVVLDAILRFKIQDPSVNTRVLIPELGFKVKLVPYRQNARKAGKSSYNLTRSIDFGINSLCGNSTKPLRIMMFVGLGLSFAMLLVAFCCAIVNAVYPQVIDGLICVIILTAFFILGVLLFCMGFISEYIAILLRKVTAKTVVVEEERLNFDDNSPKILVGGVMGRKLNLQSAPSKTSAPSLENV